MRKPFMKPIKVSDTSYVEMRVLPFDLDILWHVNNGMYFSYMDFGRWEMVFRNGLFSATKKMGWYAVVAGETIKFKKSLMPWVKFTIETKNLGQDDKYFFISQKFLVKGQLMAHGLVKVRFLKRKGGVVSPAEVLKVLDLRIENSGEALGKEWYELEQQYLSS